MEGGGGATDFDDWEMLQADEEIGEREVAPEAEAEGLMMLRLDYFSVDSGMEFSRPADKCDLVSEEGSVESDNPSWADPAGSEAVAFAGTTSGELWPDSASDRSKMSDCGEKIGFGFVESGDDHGFEMQNQRSYIGNLGFQSGGENSAGVEPDTGVVAVEKMGMTEFQSEDVTNVSEMGVRGEESCVAAAEDGKIGKEVELPNEVDKKGLIWWKLPLELVKFCVFRVSPLWSISVAAAMVGVFIMRRRLHNMKRKTQSLQMKVTVDHKKVDQFMSRAARLNEAFSVVRRVPIIRPSLPAPGVAPWPAMSLR